jgi:hypothetical protein
LSSADSRSCPARGFRECFWVYLFILNFGLVTLVSVSLVLSVPCNSKSRVGSWSVCLSSIPPVH